MLDPGASAFLAGYGPFRRFLQQLTDDCHFPIEKIKMTRGRRRFQFGGDAASWSTWSAHLPIFLDGRYDAMGPISCSCYLDTLQCCAADPS